MEATPALLERLQVAGLSDVIAIEPVAGGFAATSGLVHCGDGTSVFVKAFGEPPSDGAFAAEAEGLTVLCEAGGVATPEIILVDRDLLVLSVLQPQPGTETFWERLLSPAFVFFFKLLYPFAWSNHPAKATAAAAGGCMLVRTDALRQIGGFASIRGALIDDCTLAAALKRHRPTIWLGMSHAVRSLRGYALLADFWSMVSRSAFTQLRYSPWWLLAATALMLLTLMAPVAGVAAGAMARDPQLLAIAGLAWLALSAAYWPVVSFYRLPAAWAATLPLAAALFLAMTWASAIGYWRGTRASWKARDYGRAPHVPGR